MPIRPEDVPADPARLVAMVLALDTENERLRAIVRTLKDLLFGARSEKAAVIDVVQLPLDLDDLAVGPPPPPPPANDEGGTERKLKRPRRPAVRNIGALPKHLPRCEGDRARDHGLPLLLRSAPSDRGGDARGSRRGPGLCAGEANDLPEVRLPDLRRSGRPSQEPAASHRGWHGHDRARHPCRGLQVRLAYPAVSAGSNLCRSGRAPRPLDPGAVDEAGCVVAEAALDRKSTRLNSGHPSISY